MSWIYAVQMEVPGCHDLPIKIGIATELRARLSGHQSSHPYPLRIIAYYPAVYGQIQERRTHEKFAHLRIRGEWFRSDVQLLAFLSGECVRFRRDMQMREPKDPLVKELAAIDRGLAALAFLHTRSDVNLPHSKART